MSTYTVIAQMHTMFSDIITPFCFHLFSSLDDYVFPNILTGLDELMSGPVVMQVRGYSSYINYIQD